MFLEARKSRPRNSKKKRNTGKENGFARTVATFTTAYVVAIFFKDCGDKLSEANDFFPLCFCFQAECAGLYFEEQGPGFRCPQCSGPRRRYAKKVGDRVGTTLDGGDAPILIFSFGGVLLTIIFGFWAVNNL